MSTRALWLTVGLSLSPASASGQTTALSDLQGAVVDVSAVIQEKIIRNGETMFPRLHIAGRVAVEAEDRIATWFRTTSRLPDGRTKVGTPRQAVFTLGKPQKTSMGDTVWLFSEDTLVRLRVYGGAGGEKMTIAFAPGQGGVGCTLAFPMMPEVGVGQIRKGSAVDGTPIQILEFKMLSSTCRVSKR
jgi:hypothetical protein